MIGRRLAAITSKRRPMAARQALVTLDGCWLKKEAVPATEHQLTCVHCSVHTQQVCSRTFFGVYSPDTLSHSIAMQPLFRPMEGQHFGTFHHSMDHHSRMNSTPVSDDELDIDDSVSLSSNQESCTSPSAGNNDKAGKFQFQKFWNTIFF